MVNSEIDKLLQQILDHPIAYHRIYAKIAGGITAGLLLSQICYWSGKMKRAFWKTNDDFAEELGMGLGEFKAAKSKLIRSGFITVTRRGVPAKTHYVLDKTAVFAKIRSWSKFDQLDGQKSTNLLVKNQPTITKTKTKITTKNNKKQTDFSLDEKLALELKRIRQKAAEYELSLHQVLPARTKAERTTYNRLREHLTKLYQDGDKMIFDKVLDVAKEVRMIEVENRRGLFIKKCIKSFGFKGKGVKGKVL